MKETRAPSKKRNQIDRCRHTGSKVIKQEADVIGAGAVDNNKVKAVVNIYGVLLAANKFQITIGYEADG